MSKTDLNPPMFEGEISGPTVWTGGELGSDDGLVRLSPACLGEIDGLLATLRENPLPTVALTPADFDLPACRAAMAAAGDILAHGVGFVIIDRLPLARMSVEEATAIYWLLAAMLGRPVAQKWDGRMIYSVTDLGRPPGAGVRADVTNAEQNFHTDNSYNIRPPHHVALLCLQPASAGGISRVVSLHAVYNRMRARHPELLARLYRPFCFDRQREHAPADGKTLWNPVFTSDGSTVQCRLSCQLIRQGYALADRPLDDEATAALDAITEIVDAPDLYQEFRFEPGQIQIIDNRSLAHKRTGFTDGPDPAQKRHLVRLWLRDAGRPFYNG